MAKQRVSITRIFRPLRVAAQETAEQLGERAFFFAEIANDWIEFQGALLDRYKRQELLREATFAQFQGLLKEIVWLQWMFLGGNYALIESRLRFVWELMFHAYLADSPHDNPGRARRITIDVKLKRISNEKRWRGWAGISAVLRKLPCAAERESFLTIKETWQRLNRAVHPTYDLMGRLTGGESLLVRDGLDTEWAAEVHSLAKRVFALVWLALVDRFPRLEEDEAVSQLLRNYPYSGAEAG